ncbi:MAG: IclR family transcriptional regulator [Chloroflexi bacterium]|nr:IclR family transcriptional regulator [Chloroflexota bacterium]
MRNSSVQAVERAGHLLLYLAEHPRASLRDLAQAIGSSRTTAHRLLHALAASGLVMTTADGRPALGPAVVRLYGAWRRQTDLRRVAYPHLLALRDRSGETVSLHVRQGDAVVCVECVESEQPIRRAIAPGDVAPLLRSASSKLFLAALPEAERAALLTRLAPDDAELWERLRTELPRIREQGYATSFEERIPGAASLAAPIWDAAGTMVASLSIAGPVQRVTPAFIAEIAPVLRAVALEISQQLGFSLPTARGIVVGATHQQANPS